MPRSRPGRIALGIGLITGAITGLLFAPEEGKKIRSKIAKGDTQGLLNDLKSMGEELGAMVTDLANQPSVVETVERAKDKAADVANMKRAELDKMLKDASKKAEGFKKKISQYVKEQKATLDERFGKSAPKAAAKKVKKAVVKKVAPKKMTPKKVVVKKAAPKKAAPKKKVASKKKK